MSDFFQSNQIITLQHLRPNPHREDAIKKSQRRVVVVVPCLVSHCQTGVLQKIIECFNAVPFVSEIVVVLNGTHIELTNQDFLLTQSIEVNKIPINILLCEGLGKGRAIKMGFDYVYEHYKNTGIVITLDADLKSFSKEYFCRLVYPIAVLGGQANKGYYARFSQTALNGRLTRLLVFPLLYAIQGQCPSSELNRWLLSFRYPLSGDVALASEILPKLQLESNWAYDLSLLKTLFQYKDEISVYQTDLTDNYEHLHRDLSDDRQSGLMGVFEDIASYLLSLFPVDRDRLILDYRNLAQIYCQKYEKLALFNGIKNQDGDRGLVSQFTEHLDGLFLSQTIKS